MPRDSVKDFGKAMEATLRRNDHKGGWSNESHRYLMRRLHEEVQELSRTRLTPPEKRMKEATDVANFALMIWDNARRRR